MINDDKRTLTPRLRFPEFRDQDGWCSRELGPMTSKVGSGITPTGGEANYKSSGRPFVRSQNVGWGELILDDVAYIDEETHSSFDSSEIAAFDVLLNITGASIGRSAIADSRIVGGNVNQHVCIIRVKPDELNPVLLNQYLISEHGQKQIDSFQAGGNRQGLNFAQIRSFRITLPPTAAEQTRIADCLTSLDELIAAQGRKVETLKAHKKGLMQRLFPREGETRPCLRFPEFRNALEWDNVTLASICEIQRGKFASRPRNDPKFFGGPYPFIQTGDVVRANGGPVVASQSLNMLGLSVSKLFQPTIVLITIAANIGDTALLETEACFTDSVVGLIPRDKRVTPRFLEPVLRLKKDYLNKVATTGAQKNINNEILAALTVLLPSMAEQSRIADCLSALDARIAAEAEKLAAIKSHKKGLMQQLFPSPEETDS
ncbi:MAG: restriction endonuclease subunit S [Pirellulales bacterium]